MSVESCDIDLVAAGDNHKPTNDARVRTIGLPARRNGDGRRRQYAFSHPALDALSNIRLEEFGGHVSCESYTGNVTRR